MTRRLAVSLALAVMAASAQSTDGPLATETVNSTVIVNGRLLSDGPSPVATSGLVVGAIPVSPAEAARRQAVDTLQTQTLKVYRDRLTPTAPETVVSTKDVVVSTMPGAGAACVQIGAVGAPADCRVPKP